MGVKPPKGGGPRVIPPAGLAKARCVWIIDLGTQEVVFKLEKKLVHQIQLSFELPELQHTFDEAKGKQPFMLSRKFTVSLSPKSNTLPFIQGWFGRELTAAEKEGFDFSSLIGKCGMVTIVHTKDKKDASITYANIQAIAPMMPGSKIAKAINPLIDYAIGTATQWTEFPKIYPQLQDKIKLSPEWQSEAAKANYQSPQAATAEEVAPEDMDEEAF